MTRNVQSPLPNWAGNTIFVLFVAAAIVIWLRFPLDQKLAPGDVPKGSFMIGVSQPVLGAGKTPYPIQWRHGPLPTVDGKDKSFLMSGRSGSLVSDSDLFTYEVLEDRRTSQVIEITFNNTHTSWSQYEAFPDHIVAQRYRQRNGFNLMFLLLVFVLAGLAANWVVGRLLRRISRGARP